MKLKDYLVTFLLIGLIGLAACTPATNGTSPVVNEATNTKPTSIVFEHDGVPSIQAHDLEEFSSEEAYLAFVNEYAGNNNYYYGGPAILRAAVDEVAFAESAVADGAAVSGVAKTAVAQDLDFSETNNQVTGVDEADIIKTDGKYIYTISGNTLFIVAAHPDDNPNDGVAVAFKPGVVSTIEFDDRPEGLFIHGDRLAIFSTDYAYTVKGHPSIQPVMTTVELYDISDRSNPQQDKTLAFEGTYFNARLIDDRVYFVTQNQPAYRDVFPMPLIVEDGVAATIPVDRISFYPIPYNNPQLVHTHLFTMDGELEDSMSVAVESPQTLYMSESHMVIVGQEYVNEWEIEQDIIKDEAQSLLSEKDNALVSEITRVNPLILSGSEKKNKIMQVYYTAIGRLDEDAQEDFYETVEEELEATLKTIKYYEYTTLTQIELDRLGFDDVETGKVPGQIVNQFSLDQHVDHLRIATTINSRWDRYSGDRTDSTTNVWVLDEELELQGSLTGLAPTERIYSTRFVGDKLYMVTFRQVDPFFVIDLSNPEKPQDLGELKIPGFSRYLHPYDENHIIGIGQEADSRGRTTGLKISLFDVTDVTDPQEVAKFVTEEKYAQSTALYEHKAFLFSREKNLLVIPAYNRDYEWRSSDGQAYNGAFVFNIDEENIELRGLIDHSDYADDSRYWYQPVVERSLYIEDLLYTKSPGVIRINDLDDLSSVANVELEYTNGGDIVFY